jgi:glycosyltransferase involved in cell wall biosynthesis
MTPAAKLPHTRVLEWRDWKFCQRFPRFCSMAKPGYARFYMQARRWIRKSLQCGEHFDLAHQISPLAIRYPSPATGLGIPVIVGPVAGSLVSPPAFAREFTSLPWYVRLRSLDRWRFRYDPWLRATLTEARVVIGAAPYVQEILHDVPLQRFVAMSETGVTELPTIPRMPKCGQLKLLFVGRVIRSKGVRDAVRAMGKLRDLNHLTLDVVGDGDDLSACKQESVALGIEKRIIFHGRVSRQKVDQFYAKADIFLFPSICEPSGNAVLEAMSYGLASIVADVGGPAFAVTDACGIRIRPINPEQYAIALADAVRSLAANLDQVSKMGQAARSRIADTFLWSRKVERLLHLYDQILHDIIPDALDRKPALNLRTNDKLNLETF